MNALNIAVPITWSIDGTQIDIRIESGLHVVVDGPKRLEASDRERGRRPVECHDRSRAEILHVTAQDGRSIHAGFAYCQTRFGPIGFRNNHQYTTGGCRGVRGYFKTEWFDGRDDQPQKST